MKKIIYELYEICNELFTEKLEEKMKKMSEKKVMPEESILFMELARSSIKNSEELLSKNQYIDSLCTLRCAYEALLFGIAINIDEEIFNAYKYYNRNLIYEALKNNNKNRDKKEIKQKSKEILQPYNIRNKIIANYEKIFKDFFENDDKEKIKKEFDEFYHYLSDFTHPSIIKIYNYKIQEEEKTVLKKLYLNNINYCKILLIIGINYFINEDNEDVIKIYLIMFLFNVASIDYTDINDLKKTIRKYDKYLYLNNTQRIFNTKKIEVKTVITSLNNIITNKETEKGLTDIITEILSTYKNKKKLKKVLDKINIKEKDS